VKLVTAEQMRALEAAAAERGVSEAELMENAGVAVAQEAWINMGAAEGRIAAVLVGPGNNGGDGLAAARHLKDWGAEVFVFLLEPRAEDDPQWQALQAAGIESWTAAEDPGLERLTGLLSSAHGIIDALLGTGVSRPIDGDLAATLDKVAESRANRSIRPHLIAVDVPTGIDPDTGRADPAVVRADTTVALGYAKVGLFAMPGRAIAGDIAEVDIGLPPELGADLPYEDVRMRDLQAQMPFRSDDAHKGTFGTAVVAAGSQRYPGAARLASEAALRGGAGLVVLAAPESVQPLLAAGTPEIVHHPLPGADGAVDASAAPELLRALAGNEVLLLGPGLSHTAATAEFVAQAIAGLDAVEGLRAAVIDADALNALAERPGWHEGLALPRVLTPHPGEMARLLGSSVDEVQNDRLRIATRYAQLTQSVVVLKGAGTIIAAPDGRARLSEFASAVLATAGTGDVLAGFVASLLAQGMEPFDAATAAVYLHTECGRALEGAMGSATAVASDLLRALPEVRKSLDV
jgi:NAD(P)H-hydrate epimerase